MQTAIEPAARPQAWVNSTIAPEAAGPFSTLYRETGKDEQRRWQQFWRNAQEQWLASGRRRSEHTRRAYREALAQFEDYCASQAII